MTTPTELQVIHGRIVTVDKFKLSIDFQSYVIGFEDGYIEGRVKVFEPHMLNKLTALLNQQHIIFRMEPLTTPPEPKGTVGWLVSFDFDPRIKRLRPN